VIERLNALLRDELAAVAGYQKALTALRKKALADGDHILRRASDHQRTVTALNGSVRSRGGVPVVGARPWEGSGVTALTSDGALLGERDFLDALLAVEQRGLAAYERALGSLDEEARELVELELIPRQKRHVEALSTRLDGLAG
jgi:bacterioferritin (cytochrome b1)